MTLVIQHLERNASRLQNAEAVSGFSLAPDPEPDDRGRLGDVEPEMRNAAWPGRVSLIGGHCLGRLWLRLPGAGGPGLYPHNQILRSKVVG